MTQHIEFTTRSALNLKTLEVMAKHYDDKNGGVYRTGIYDVDNRIIYRDGTFNIVAARSGDGKTRFILAMVLRMLSLGYKVAYVTAEDDDENINMQMLELEMSEKKFSRLGVWTREYDFNYVKKCLLESTEFCKQYEDNFFFFNVGRIGLDRVYGLMESAKKLGVQVFIYDYLQTITLPGADTYTRHSEIAEGIRAKAKELKLCTIGALQLNRDADATKTDTPPSMANIKGSGDYEQTAASIILVKRRREKVDNVYVPTENIELHMPKVRLTGKIYIALVDKNYQKAENSNGVPSEFGKDENTNGKRYKKYARGNGDQRDRACPF